MWSNSKPYDHEALPVQVYNSDSMNVFWCIFSLDALRHCSQACVSHNCLHMHTPTRTHAYTLPLHKCQPIFHILFPKMSVPWTKLVRRAASLAVCLPASHLQLLSPPDISHARGHRTNMPAEYSSGVSQKVRLERLSHESKIRWMHKTYRQYLLFPWRAVMWLILDP